MKTRLFAVSSLLVLGACRALSDPVVCPAVVPPSVIVTVEDSVSGANVTPGATVELRNGGYIDSVVAPPTVTAAAVGGNRTGTFTVTVSQAGYRSWTKTGVKVDEGPCGAKTVKLTARLQRAP